MNMGGDDFIVKPFDLTVLAAKIRALLRRTYDFAGQTNLLEHKGAILTSARLPSLTKGKRCSSPEMNIGSSSCFWKTRDRW